MSPRWIVAKAGKSGSKRWTLTSLNPSRSYHPAVAAASLTRSIGITSSRDADGALMNRLCRKRAGDDRVATRSGCQAGLQLSGYPGSLDRWREGTTYVVTPQALSKGPVGEHQVDQLALVFGDRTVKVRRC